MTRASFSRTLVPQRRSSGSTTHRPRTNADVIRRRVVEAEAWQRQRQLRIPRWVHLLEWLVRMALRRVVLPVVRRQLVALFRYRLSPVPSRSFLLRFSLHLPLFHPLFLTCQQRGRPKTG